MIATNCFWLMTFALKTWCSGLGPDDPLTQPRQRKVFGIRTPQSTSSNLDVPRMRGRRYCEAERSTLVPTSTTSIIAHTVVPQYSKYCTCCTVFSLVVHRPGKDFHSPCHQALLKDLISHHLAIRRCSSGRAREIYIECRIAKIWRIQHSLDLLNFTRPFEFS